MGCAGGNDGGDVKVEMTDEEYQSFVEAIPAAMADGDMINYFEEHLDEDLSDRIRGTIVWDFMRRITEHVYSSMDPYDFFDRELSEKEIKELLKKGHKAVIDKAMEYGSCDLDFCIVEIENVKKRKSRKKKTETEDK